MRKKVVIVTGAGKGIGRAIADRFAREGATVYIADIDEEAGKQAEVDIQKGGADARFIWTNVADPSSVAKLVESVKNTHSQIDVLVNNAALTGTDGAFIDLTLDRWDQVLSVNVRGVFLCSQKVAKVMPRTGGVIINISSTNGTIPQPQCAAYATSKGAIESLTRSMAVDLAHRGIRVCAVAPGPIDPYESTAAQPSYQPMALLRRAGRPSEVAATCVFLSSADCGYLTGQTVVVDGGTLINGHNVYTQRETSEMNSYPSEGYNAARPEEEPTAKHEESGVATICHTEILREASVTELLKVYAEKQKALYDNIRSWNRTNIAVNSSALAATVYFINQYIEKHPSAKLLVAVRELSAVLLPIALVGAVITIAWLLMHRSADYWQGAMNEVIASIEQRSMEDASKHGMWTMIQEALKSRHKLDMMKAQALVPIVFLLLWVAMVSVTSIKVFGG